MVKENIMKSTCGMCFAACGIRIHIAEGQVVRVSGDPDSPINQGVLCPKGLASRELLYHPDRLKHPLKRGGEKGDGKWKQISWDEALNTIAGEFIKAKDTFGAQSIAFIQGSAKGLIDNYNERLANAFGTPNFSTTGNVCFLPRLFASKITCGSYTVPDYEHSPACILVWGANLAETRIGEHYRTACQLSKGTELIVVDPVQTVLAGKARFWLQLRPATDLALALGMIHVIINEAVYDRNFVNRFTVGFERLKAQVQMYSPSEVSRITWVPSETIKEAARFYAKAKPACTQWGNGIDYGINSFQTARALSILKAITGNIDVPGGDLLPSYPLAGQAAPDIVMRDRVSPEEWANRVGSDQKLLPLFRRILPKYLLNAILEEKPYAIHGVYVHAANPLLTYTNANKTLHAFKKLNFLAVADFFMTPTASLADIVLPAATFFEYDNIVAPPYYPYAQVQQQAVRIAECRSDLEITTQLAGWLGLGHLFWKNEEDFLDAVLKPTGLSFADFREKGVLCGTSQYRKYEKGGFDTPSGKIELYSSQLASWGFEPLPVYQQLPEASPGDSKPAENWPLVMTTKKSVYYLHSCGRQIKALRGRHPDPIVYLHPEIACRLSIAHGDWVYIETRLGRIKQKAALSDRIDPRVVCADFAWWFPEKEPLNLYGWAESNLNILIDDQPPDSPETGSANLRGLPCKVYRV